MNGLNGVNGVGALTSPQPIATAITSAATHIGNGNKLAPEVYQAICKVAKELSRDGIAKGHKNQQQGYGFRGIDDVMNALSALLAGAELIILPRMRTRRQEERRTAADKPLFYVTVKADFDFVSARDGSIHTVTMFGEAMDSADKATNKAMSAAYKYACLQVFCIPTEGMADADQTTPQLAPPKPMEIDATDKTPYAIYDDAPDPEPPPIAPKPQARERQPAPWINRGQMKRVFGRMRDRVGDATYREGMLLFKGNEDLTWTSAAQALDCYEWLLKQAVA
jgi:hypothetical protein